MTCNKIIFSIDDIDVNFSSDETDVIFSMDEYDVTWTDLCPDAAQLTMLSVMDGLGNNVQDGLGNNITIQVYL